MPLIPRYLNPTVRTGSACAAIPAVPVPPENFPNFSSRSKETHSLSVRTPATARQTRIARESDQPSFGTAFRNPQPAIRNLLSLTLLFLLCLTRTTNAAGVLVRDLAMVSGARDNQLVGYGLVVGLAGDGDKDPVYTKQTIANLLQRYGISVPATTLSAKNVAVVMITADIPAFIKPGERIDVHVASMGDAKSLQGGVLLQAPLLGADNKVYAVAQGPLSVGGFSAGQGGGGGASVTKNHPTTAQIVGGALVEREIPTSIVRDNTIDLLLREPGFTTAARLAAAINHSFTNSARAIDSASVRVRLPEGLQDSPVDFIAHLQNIQVTPEVPARIIINERTGTIVATARIRINSCAVSHGNITINVASTLDVSQPAPFSNTGETVVTERTTTDVTETRSAIFALPELPTVEKVAGALNALGVTPRDMMAIFQAMKQAGALQAELIIR